MVLALLSIVASAGAAHSQSRPITTVASAPAALRQWDGIVDQMLRTGELEVRRADNDTIVSGRVHTRLRQLHHGVPVYGAEMTRQTGPSGTTVSIFGTMYQDIAIDPTPALGVDDAVDAIERLSGVRLGPDRLPTLYVLPAGDGYKLAYRARVFSLTADTRVLHRRERRNGAAADGGSQAAVGGRERDRRAERPAENECQHGCRWIPGGRRCAAPVARHLRHEGEPAAHARLPER